MNIVWINSFEIDKDILNSAIFAMNDQPVVWNIECSAQGRISDFKIAWLEERTKLRCLTLKNNSAGDIAILVTRVCCRYGSDVECNE